MEKDTSLVEKRRALESLDNINASQLKDGKAATKNLQSTAKAAGDKMAEELKGSSKFLVRVVAGLEDDLKHLMIACQEGKKGNTGSVLLISGGAVVADVKKDGAVSAKEWVNAVLEPFNGKGGGSDIKAQGKAGAMDS